MKIENRDKDRQHTAPKTIIHLEKITKRINEENGEDKQQARQPFIRYFYSFIKQALLEILQGIDTQNRERESEQNAKIHDRRVENYIDDLTQRAKDKQHKEMLNFIAGISAAFGDGKREKGHGQPPDGSPRQKIKGEPNHSDMVYRHKQRRQ